MDQADIYRSPKDCFYRGTQKKFKFFEMSDFKIFRKDEANQ